MQLKNIILGVLFACFTLAGCEKEKSAHDHPQLTTGKQLYDFHCSECHQKDAKGKFFYGFPDLVELKLDIADIRTQVLGKDGPGRKMPSFADMPDEELLLIAKYITSLK